MLDASPLPSTITPAIRLGDYVDRLFNYVAEQATSIVASDTEYMAWEIVGAASEDVKVARIYARMLDSYLTDYLGPAAEGVTDFLDMIVTTASEEH